VTPKTLGCRTAGERLKITAAASSPSSPQLRPTFSTRKLRGDGLASLSTHDSLTDPLNHEGRQTRRTGDCAHAIATATTYHAVGPSGATRMVETTLIPRADHSHYEIATSKTNFNGEYTSSSVIVTLAVALALYNSLEMGLLISTTFKKFKGLYFWALVLCNLGVVGFALGMMLSYFELCVLWLAKVILDVGWVLMILFQALVLYSRLGLIYDDRRIFQGVKWMIVFTSITLLIPVVVLDFGTTYSNEAGFSEGYYYIEQIMMVGITIQELVISGLYVFKTIQFLKIIERENTRSMVWQLLAINIIIICMDVSHSPQSFVPTELTEITDGYHRAPIPALPALPRSHQSLCL
jgi:hypothetical protein